MTTVKMNAPHSASWQGRHFEIVGGIAHVPAAAVEDMKSHGWTVCASDAAPSTYEQLTLEQLVEEAAKRQLGPSVAKIKEEIIEMLHRNDSRKDFEKSTMSIEADLDSLDKLRSKDDVRAFADAHKIALGGVADKLADLKEAVANSLKAQ